MHRYSVEFLDALPAEIEAKVEHGHESHETLHGVVCDYRKFLLAIQNGAGATVGVLSACSAYAEIYVDDIWIDSGHRSLGLGKRLREALEERFEDKGYNNINLVTNDFQAVGFYEKCGYEIEFVRTNKHHPKLSETFFIKYFDAESQTRGIGQAAQRSRRTDLAHQKAGLS